MLRGTVFSAIERIVPSWLMNTMSSGTSVFFIHIWLSCGRPQSNSMPPVSGTEVRNISPVRCCVGRDRHFDLELVLDAVAADDRQRFVRQLGLRRGLGEAGRAGRERGERRGQDQTKKRSAVHAVTISLKARSATRFTASRTGPSRGASRKVVNQCAGGLRPAARL